MTRLPVAMVGRAWRTPLGATIDEVMARWLAGERAVMVNPRCDASGYAVQLAAPIRSEPARSRNARFLRRMGLFGLEVAQEALAASGLAPSARFGLFSGVGGLRAHWDDMMSGLRDQDDDGRDAWNRGLRDVHPYWMLKHLSNNVHALASAELRLRGEGATFGGGTGGAQAIASAARALWDGAIDAALVVAHDSLLEAETLVELGERRAATRATDPREVAPAYDPRAAGFVPGEAAAAIVLVRPRDAAKPLALVEAIDTATGERHEPSIDAIERVAVALADRASTVRRDGNAWAGIERGGIERGGIERGGIAIVDGASRAWPDLDDSEREMLGRIAPEAVLVSIASAMGRLGAATAVVQAIALGETLARGARPPVAAGGARDDAGGARAALAVSTAAPGLAAAIRVEVPR